MQRRALRRVMREDGMVGIPQRDRGWLVQGACGILYHVLGLGGYWQCLGRTPTVSDSRSRRSSVKPERLERLERLMNANMAAMQWYYSLHGCTLVVLLG